ncbi:MAG: hypothetical protein CMF41_05125 [Legionellales bacterium]|nr:hypothetical protein [Legionellales bacterium]OUX64733.1 MAG: hypothetical protein CBE41_02780 [Gammaproteobacteria bacterium TMED281]
MGHNESDEPSMTQPLMYNKIKSYESILSIYSKKLIASKTITNEKYNELNQNIKSIIKNGDKLVNDCEDIDEKQWDSFSGKEWFVDYNSNLSKNKLIQLAKKISTIPANIKPHKSVINEYKKRSLMANEERLLDWGMAEMLAYSSLIDEGYALRFTGQDCQRGTFSHRHAVIHCSETNTQHNVLYD